MEDYANSAYCSWFRLMAPGCVEPAPMFIRMRDLVNPSLAVSRLSLPVSTTVTPGASSRSKTRLTEIQTKKDR